MSDPCVTAGRRSAGKCQAGRQVDVKQAGGQFYYYGQYGAYRKVRQYCQDVARRARRATYRQAGSWQIYIGILGESAGNPT